MQIGDKIYCPANKKTYKIIGMKNRGFGLSLPPQKDYYFRLDDLSQTDISGALIEVHVAEKHWKKIESQNHPNTNIFK